MELTVASRSRALVALAIVAVTALGARSGLGGAGLLCLAPTLALMAVLLARRYPGERLLIALAASHRDRWPRPSEAARRSRTRTSPRVPRGGLLMGFELAGRPPPAAAPLAS